MEYCGRINNIEGVDHKNSQMITVRYLFSHRKHRYELVDETKKTTQQNSCTQRISKQSNHGL